MKIKNENANQTHLYELAFLVFDLLEKYWLEEVPFQLEHFLFADPNWRFYPKKTIGSQYKVDSFNIVSTKSENIAFIVLIQIEKWFKHNNDPMCKRTIA